MKSSLRGTKDERRRGTEREVEDKKKKEGEKKMYMSQRKNKARVIESEKKTTRDEDAPRVTERCPGGAISPDAG